MNPEARARLDDILKLAPEALNPDQKAFLRARRGELKTSQLDEYKKVLEANDTPEEVEDEKVKVDYQVLLKRAKELGYSGKRMKRPELEQYVFGQEKQKNPFN